MNKRMFANCFGLIALTCLSLFASTRVRRQHSGANPSGCYQHPAQPVPVVGLVTDADNAARQFFQTDIVGINVNGGGMFYKITSAPAA